MRQGQRTSVLLGDDSLAATANRHAIDIKELARIKAIDAKGFPEQDLISHDLFLRQLQQRIEDYDLKEYEMPISGMGGIHTSLADLPLSMPFDSVSCLRSSPFSWDEKID